VLLFVVSLIPVVQLFLQRKEPEWLVLVPVSAQYTLLNLALRGEAIPPVQLALSYVVPFALMVLALAGVARQLSREAILASR
jgi:hydrogenase/urease accessory protein HupE